MDSPRAKNPKLIYVRWIDSFTPYQDRWYSETELDEFIDDSFVADSVGWLVHEDEEMLTLVSTKSPGAYVHLLRIPRVSVLKKRTLK